jgi:hypothetical protein
MAESNPDIAGLTALVQQLLAEREVDRRERDQVALELERARQATVPVPSVIQPVLPKIGGISNGVVWVGGEPNVSWTETKNLEPRSAYCRRHTTDKDLKVLEYMLKAHVPKFKRDDPLFPLVSFASDVETHMELTGMDSVFWFADPTDPTQMLNVFTSHSRFPENYVAQEVSRKLKNGTYDKYDIQNLEFSANYLRESLDVTLRGDIRGLLRPKITGPELFMTVVSEIQSSSVRLYRAKERQLEAMSLKTYPGENVKTLTRDIANICDELDRAGRLPEDITLTIVNIYAKSSVEEFRIYFIGRRVEVERFLKKSSGKSRDVVRAMDDYIGYKEMGLEANSQYQSLIDSGNYGPATTANDAGDAPQVFMTKTDTTALIQQKLKTSTRDTSTIKCFKCGKMGHFANKCPDTTTPSNVPSGAPNWKKVAPAATDEQTKTVDEVKYYWCDHANCKRWNPSHLTENHGRRDTEGNLLQEEANAAVDVAPETPSGNLGAW